MLTAPKPNELLEAPNAGALPATKAGVEDPKLKAGVLACPKAGVVEAPKAGVLGVPNAGALKAPKAAALLCPKPELPKLKDIDGRTRGVR